MQKKSSSSGGPSSSISRFHCLYITTAVFSFLSAIAAACGASLVWISVDTSINIELDLYPFQQCIITTSTETTNKVCGYLDFDLQNLINNKYWAFFGGFASAISILFAILAFIMSLGAWCGITGVVCFLIFSALFQATASVLGIYWWWENYKELNGFNWGIGLIMVLISLFFTLLALLTLSCGACSIWCRHMCNRNYENEDIEEYGNSSPSKRSSKKSKSKSQRVNSGTALKDYEYGPGSNKNDNNNQDDDYDEESQVSKREKKKDDKKSRANRVKAAQEPSRPEASANEDESSGSWNFTSLFRRKKSEKKTTTKSNTADVQVSKNPAYQPPPLTPSVDYSHIPRQPLSDEALLQRTLMMVQATDGDVATEEDMVLLIPRVQNTLEDIAQKSGTDMDDALFNRLTIAAMKAIFDKTRVDIVRSRKWVTIVTNTVTSSSPSGNNSSTSININRANSSVNNNNDPDDE